jgi:hypothetical protein
VSAISVVTGGTTDALEASSYEDRETFEAS